MTRYERRELRALRTKSSHTKFLTDPKLTQESLLYLRDELIHNPFKSINEIIMKINSCLYSGYPHEYHEYVEGEDDENN